MNNEKIREKADVGNDAGGKSTPKEDEGDGAVKKNSTKADEGV
jgi:hypothetical protein